MPNSYWPREENIHDIYGNQNNTNALNSIENFTKTFNKILNQSTPQQSPQQAPQSRGGLGQILKGVGGWLGGASKDTENWLGGAAKNVGNFFTDPSKASGRFFNQFADNINEGMGAPKGSNLIKSTLDMLNGDSTDLLGKTTSTAKDFLKPMNAASLAIKGTDKLWGAFGGKTADKSTMSGGTKALDIASKLPLNYIPVVGTALNIAVKGANLLNTKVFGGTGKNHVTDEHLDTTGYNKNFTQGGLQYAWTDRSKRRKQNRKIANLDADNMLASNYVYINKQNTAGSANYSGALQNKTDMELMGGYGTHAISARMGAKIPPVNLRKIVNKASHKYQQGNAINRPDIKPINKLDVKPIKSTPGSTDFSNIISKALKSREEKLKAPETFEEYRLRIGKLNQNFLVDDPSYNLKGAYEAKLEPTLHEDGTYHLGSRDTNTGKIFKLPTHHSFEQTLAGEEEAGHVMYLKDGELYSAPKEQVSSSDREAAEQFIRKAMSKSYKDGGLLNKADKKEVIEEVTEEKTNVIPEGAFHSRKNNIHEDYAEHVTKKGIPVITKDEDGKIIQHAEVERNEIIFHKEATDTIESLHEKYKKAETQKLKDEIMIECGKYVADQILVNTDDRTGIIKAVEYA